MANQSDSQLLAVRTDGRSNDQLRPVRFTPGFAPNADGSVLIATGNTQVICAATVEAGVPRWMKDQGVSGGWITAEYSMLPYSTVTRRPRDISKGETRWAKRRDSTLDWPGAPRCCRSRCPWRENPLDRLRCFAGGRRNQNSINHRCLHCGGVSVRQTSCSGGNCALADSLLSRRRERWLGRWPAPPRSELRRG